MGENPVICPNCRQAVPPKATSGSAMLRCPACGLRFLPVAEGAFTDELPSVGVPPRINPAPRRTTIQMPAPAGNTSAPVALPPIIVTDKERGSTPSPVRVTVSTPSIAPAPTPAVSPAGEAPAPAALPTIIDTENDRGRAPSPARATAPAPSIGGGPAPSIASGPRPQRGKNFGPLEIVKVVLGGAFGLGMGYLLVFWLQYRNAPDPDVASRDTSARTTASSTSSRVQFPDFRPPAVPAAPSSPAFAPPPYSGFGTPLPSTVPPSPPDGHPGHSTPNFVPPPRDVPSPEPGPSTPPAQAPQQPLDGLAEILKLPSLVDTAPASITSLHVPEDKKLDISLNSVAANIPAEATFFTETKEGTPLTWLVCYAPNLSGTPGDKRLLAEMTHAGGELKFAWREPIEDAEIRKELLNCLMRLTCENVSKASVLRPASDAPRLVLDLTKEIGTHSLPPVDLPKEESLRLEVTALTAFPAGAVLKDDKRVLKVRERTVIQFQQLQGAEIQLEFRRQPEGTLQIVLRPEFRENRTEKVPMTLPRLADLKAGMEREIPEGEAKLVALGRELKTLNDQLKNLGPRPGGAAFAAWQTKLNSLQSGISNCKSRISRLSRRLPEMKARLAAVPAMEQFLREMHQKASLAVRVYAECGDAKLVLIDAHLDHAADDQQPGT